MDNGVPPPLGKRAGEKIRRRRQLLQRFQAMADDSSDECDREIFNRSRDVEKVNKDTQTARPTRESRTYLSAWDILMSVKRYDGTIDEAALLQVHGTKLSPSSKKGEMSKTSSPLFSMAGERYENHQGCCENPVTECQVIDLTIEENAKSNNDVSRKNTKLPSIACRVRCNYLDGITMEEENVLEEGFRAPPDHVVAELLDSKIALRSSSFRRLRENEWLDDEIINGFAGMVNRRSRDIHLHPYILNGAVPRTYMFSSFFFTRLCEGKGSTNYKGVRRWTERAGVSVNECDLLLIPINVLRNHWAVIAIDMAHKEFTYLDPLYNFDHCNTLRSLKMWLHAELEDKMGREIAEKYGALKWTERTNRYRVKRSGVLPFGLQNASSTCSDILELPVQTDSCSCGVFCIKIADCLSMGIPVYFGQGDTRLLRKKIALDLLRTYLPL